MTTDAGEAKSRKEEEYNGTLVFEQPYVQSRVIIKNDGTTNIEFAILGGPSISVDETNELVAKSVYAGLDVAYKAALIELQEKMLAALSSIQDAAELQGTPPHIEGIESEDS